MKYKSINLLTNDYEFVRMSYFDWHADNRIELEYKHKITGKSKYIRFSHCFSVRVTDESYMLKTWDDKNYQSVLPANSESLIVEDSDYYQWLDDACAGVYTDPDHGGGEEDIKHYMFTGIDAIVEILSYIEPEVSE